MILHKLDKIFKNLENRKTFDPYRFGNVWKFENIILGTWTFEDGQFLNFADINFCGWPIFEKFCGHEGSNKKMEQVKNHKTTKVSVQENFFP